MDRWLINTPRWLMLTALVFAPWAYGATRPEVVTILNWIVAGTFGLWSLGYLLRRELPSLPWLLVLPVLALVGQAWFMVGNARFDYDTTTHQFVPLTPWLAGAPGSLHRALSIENAAQFTAMLAALCLFCDLARNPIWRRRLLWTVAGTGASIAALGLVQKLTGAKAVLWEPGDMGQTFFGTFRYHANAGALLNLTWPLAAAFALLAFQRDSARWKKIVWATAVVLLLGGLTANTSRASGVLGLLLLVAWAGWIAWHQYRGHIEGFEPARMAVLGVLLLGIIVSLAFLAGMDTTLQRWSEFDRQLTTGNSRLQAAQVCLDMAPQAGAWGFGPGTFQTAFPYFTHGYGKELKGRWIFAHQDYLQTVVEWGFVGTALWLLVIAGGLIRSGMHAWRVRAELSLSARVLHFALVGALGSVLLHALVDFPLQIASLQLYTAALLGTLWASGHWLKGETRRPEVLERARNPVRPPQLAQPC